VRGHAAILGIKQLQLARFRQIDDSVLQRDIWQRFGKPDRMWGSGVLRYEYDLIGGGVVTITFSGLHVGEVTHGDKVLFRWREPEPPAGVWTHTVPPSPRQTLPDP